MASGKNQKFGRNKRGGRAETQKQRSARNKARAVAAEKAKGNPAAGCPATFPSFPAPKPRLYTVQTTGAKPDGARVKFKDSHGFLSTKQAPRGFFSIGARARGAV